MNKKFQKECESSCEYILPDYLGDVKKLLMTSARVIPSGQFASDDAVELTGIVQYDVTYLDAENKLSAASFTSDYDTSFGIDGESYCGSFVRSSVGTYSIRLTGPRRMSAKTSVISEACVSEAVSFEPSGSAFSDGNTPELVYQNVKTENLLSGEPMERELAEEAARLENVTADDIEVITSGALVRIDEASAVDGGAELKGVIIFTALIRTDGGAPFIIKKEMPFSETVSIEGASPEMSALGDAFVSSATCGVSDCEDGASIVANVIMEVKCAVLCNTEAELARDGYLVERDTEERYESVNYEEHVRANQCSAVLNLKLSREEAGLENLKDILSLSAVFKVPELDTSERDMKIKAEAQFSGVACEINEEGEDTYAPLKLSRPVIFDVNNNLQIPQGSNVAVKLSPTLAEWSLDADYLYLKCMPTLSVCVSMPKSCERLVSCDVTSDREYGTSLSRVCVYYPESEETLFGIAKKFHTKIENISRDNDISETVAAFGDTPAYAHGFSKLIIR